MSQKRSILQILASAAVFLIFFNAVVKIPQIRQQYESTGDLAANRIQAQTYMLAGSQPDTVLLGSSLAYRLSASKLGNGAHSLCFAADSALAGLRLIDARSDFPRRVIIEVNVVDRIPRQDLLDDATSPVLLAARRWLPALRERYSPKHLMAGPLRGACGAAVRLKQRVLGSSPQDQSTQIGKGAVSGEFERLLTSGVKEAQRPDPFAVLESQLQEMRSQVERLETNGVECFLLWMPMHPDIKNAPRFNHLRSRTEKLFPRAKYIWLQAADGQDYPTTDGLHLTSEAADQFADELNRQLSRSAASVNG